MSKPVNEVLGDNDEKLNSKMLEELSIGGNDGDQNDYESDFKSTKRGSNATDKKEKNLLLRPQKTKEVYQTPSM